MKQVLQLRINGRVYEVFTNPRRTLLNVLREDLGLTGTKEGCGRGDCGSCTVIVDGRAVKSCVMQVQRAVDKEILTIEGLAQNGKLHPLQQAFIDHFAVQCGFCTPGMIMRAKALLDENPNPIEEDIKKALVGNICRCTGYVKIIEAILAAASKMRGVKSE